ncbi:hypothetical protein N752_25980 [Desulforamulus aquiferis]|nr:hypothetical protein [Desulforamulus aquiferis]RYD02265.1 hypothetical protein N752_25980 [Desulforamulus aquiferis]
MWFDGGFPWDKSDSECFPDKCMSNPCHKDKCIPDKQFLMKLVKCLCILKRELEQCEKILCNPKFGLKEIKSEVKQIEVNVETILEVIFSPTFGLREIKTEVAGIEDAIFSPTFGLQEIKSEVAGIEDAVFSPTFGLQEIKTEIIEILANQGIAPYLSTGPFFVDCLEQTLHLKVLNYTTSSQSVNFIIHSLANCPITIGAITVPLINIPPCCAAFVEVPLPGEGERNLEIRAELSAASQGILIYAATKTGLPNCQVPRSMNLNMLSGHP